MTDAFTDELFPENPHVVERVIYPLSRLVVDPERFINDEEEPMASIGMGQSIPRHLVERNCGSLFQ
jgi:N-formylglutamate deformylase